VLKTAFKEWAAVCRALAEGRQSLILRKGGIAEAGGEFKPDHERFWLYPTYLHEHRAGVKAAALPLFEQASALRPQTGRVILSHFAQVVGVHRVADWKHAAALDDLHIWSSAAVRAKFDYRVPGLFALIVRVFRGRQPVELPETAAYAGCKTWVQLDRELAIDGALPVVDDAAFDQVQTEIERRLNVDQ
jgi:hypothetical protein